MGDCEEKENLLHDKQRAMGELTEKCASLGELLRKKTEQNTKLGKDLMELNNPRHSNDMKQLTRRNAELENDICTLKEDVQNIQSKLDMVKESEYALTCCKKAPMEKNESLQKERDKLTQTVEEEAKKRKRHLDILSEKLKEKHAAEVQRLGDGLTTA